MVVVALRVGPCRAFRRRGAPAEGDGDGRGDAGEVAVGDPGLRAAAGLPGAIGAAPKRGHRHLRDRRAIAGASHELIEREQLDSVGDAVAGRLQRQGRTSMALNFVEAVVVRRTRDHDEIGDCEGRRTGRHHRGIRHTIDASRVVAVDRRCRRSRQVVGHEAGSLRDCRHVVEVEL